MNNVTILSSEELLEVRWFKGIFVFQYAIFNKYGLAFHF